MMRPASRWSCSMRKTM